MPGPGSIASRLERNARWRQSVRRKAIADDGMAYHRLIGDAFLSSHTRYPRDHPNQRRFEICRSVFHCAERDQRHIPTKTKNKMNPRGPTSVRVSR
jgi:hypothetical protein